MMQAMAGALARSGGLTLTRTLEGQAGLRFMLQRMTDSGGRAPSGMAGHHQELLHITPWTGVAPRINAP